jgi:hypothetical protein
MLLAASLAPAPMNIGVETLFRVLFAAQRDLILLSFSKRRRTVLYYKSRLHNYHPDFHRDRLSSLYHCPAFSKIRIIIGVVEKQGCVLFLSLERLGEVFYSAQENTESHRSFSLWFSVFLRGSLWPIIEESQSSLPLSHAFLPTKTIVQASHFFDRDNITMQLHQCTEIYTS